jgi:hypothetical protein
VSLFSVLGAICELKKKLKIVTLPQGYFTDNERRLMCCGCWREREDRSAAGA